MNFAIREQEAGCVVVSCRGGLSWEERDHLAANVDRHLERQDGPPGVVVDMTGVDFINSAGIGALFQLLQRVRDRDGKLVFASMSGTIERLLATVGIFRLSGRAPDVSAALEQLRSPPEPLESTPSEPTPES